MTKTTHTPEPWTLIHMGAHLDLKGNNGNTLIACFPVPAKTEGVAYQPSDEDAANLKLIAAAPDLKAICESLVAMSPSSEGLGGHAPIAAFLQLAEGARKILKTL